MAQWQSILSVTGVRTRSTSTLSGIPGQQSYMCCNMCSPHGVTRVPKMVRVLWLAEIGPESSMCACSPAHTQNEHRHMIISLLTQSDTYATPFTQITRTLLILPWTQPMLEGPRQAFGTPCVAMGMLLYWIIVTVANFLLNFTAPALHYSCSFSFSAPSRPTVLSNLSDAADILVLPA